MDETTDSLNTNIAKNFSGHKFAETYDTMAEDIIWDNIGGKRLEGKAAVVAECEDSAGYLEGVTTEFSKLESLEAGNVVIIQSVATYTDGDNEVSQVASCDIYTFKEGVLTRIVSYNIEVAEGQLA